VEGVANFVLCHLPEDGADAQTAVDECRKLGVFLRDVSSTSRQSGRHAIRIAVKDADDNDRVIEAIAAVLNKNVLSPSDATRT